MNPYVCMYIYIYIYTHTESERERDQFIYIAVAISYSLKVMSTCTIRNGQLLPGYQSNKNLISQIK